METRFYYVHSDIDENNTAATFEDLDSAIEYAKEGESCWVDEVFCDEDGEIVSEETVWAYADEE